MGSSPLSSSAAWWLPPAETTGRLLALEIPLLELLQLLVLALLALSLLALSLLDLALLVLVLFVLELLILALLILALLLLAPQPPSLQLSALLPPSLQGEVALSGQDRASCQLGGGLTGMAWHPSEPGGGERQEHEEDQERAQPLGHLHED